MTNYKELSINSTERRNRIRSFKEECFFCKRNIQSQNNSATKYQEFGYRNRKAVIQHLEVKSSVFGWIWIPSCLFCRRKYKKKAPEISEFIENHDNLIFYCLITSEVFDYKLNQIRPKYQEYYEKIQY